MKYQQDQIIRNKSIDGVDRWIWPKQDTGAWDGPVDDWVTSHRPAYLKHVDDWSICVQAGGNMGLYPRLLSQMFQVVYTFEPDSYNFYYLVQNCQVDNIIKIQAAVGDNHQRVYVNRQCDWNLGMVTVEQDDYAIIPQIKIDDLELPACGMIQLDVEQYEIHALRGAVQTIDAYHPVIAVENNNDRIRDLLTPFGYQQVAVSKMDTIYKVKSK